MYVHAFPSRGVANCGAAAPLHCSVAQCMFSYLTNERRRSNVSEVFQPLSSYPWSLVYVSPFAVIGAGSFLSGSESRFLALQQTHIPHERARIRVCLARRTRILSFFRVRCPLRKLADNRSGHRRGSGFGKAKVGRGAAVCLRSALEVQANRTSLQKAENARFSKG